MIRRLLRGGSYDFGTRNLRSTYRFRYLPDYRFGIDGFRLIIRREP